MYLIIMTTSISCYASEAYSEGEADNLLEAISQAFVSRDDKLNTYKQLNVEAFYLSFFYIEM